MEKPVNQIKEKPEEFKKALSVLNEEMMLYKDGIVAGTIALTPEAIMRLQDAIKDFADPTSVTLDDLDYHTTRLKETRLALVPKTEGGDTDVTPHN